MFKEKMFTPKEVQELKNMCIGEVKKVHGIVFVASSSSEHPCNECAFNHKHNGIKKGCNNLQKKQESWGCVRRLWKLADDLLSE